jgi:hypothetical protein
MLEGMTKRPEQANPAVTCCGAAFHEITVQGTGTALSLYRCTSCDRQQWTCDGVAVPRDTALERLASSYRKVPAPRATTDTAAARRTARRPVAVPNPQPETSSELVDLLDGWKVLGTPS